MDEIAAYNQARWDELAAARAVFTRPWLELSIERARRLVDPYGLLGNLNGADVLCIGSGGGQQSVAFARLGARVTSVDISPEQVARDLEAATQYGEPIRAEVGDMRDLSRFADGSFDVVHHPYSINFVPDPTPVFKHVARVLRPRGVYQLFLANPFSLGLTLADWDGEGYVLRTPYIQGGIVRSDNAPWFFGGEAPPNHIDGPIEYCHTLATIVNGLAACELAVVHLREVGYGQPNLSAEPGTGGHLSAFVPPWLEFVIRYLPKLLDDQNADATG